MEGVLSIDDLFSRYCARDYLAVVKFAEEGGERYFSRNVNFWLIYGGSLKELGRLNEAVRAMDNAILLAPDVAQLHSNRADYLNTIGSFESALDSARVALSLSSFDVSAKVNYAVALAGLGRIPEAIELYEDILESGADVLQVFVNLGVLYQKIGDISRAEFCYKKVLSKDEVNRDCINNYGGLLWQKKDYFFAAKLYGSLISLFPDFAVGYKNLLGVLVDWGNFDRSLKLAESYIHKFGVDSLVLRYMGDTYRWRGDVKLSIQCYLKSASLGEEEGRSLIWLLVLFYISNDFKGVQWSISLISGEVLSAIENNRVLKAYFFYLSRLVAGRSFVHNSLGARPLYVFGDSHALAYQGIRVQYDEDLLEAKVFWLEGAKQWHLANSLDNKYKNFIRRVAAGFSKDVDVLAVFGEIDCRIDEGVLNFVEKNPGEKLLDVINRTCSGYVDFLSGVFLDWQGKVFVSGVPLPSASRGLVDYEYKRLIDFISSFNAVLSSFVLARGMIFVDFERLVSDFGDQVFVDNVHISPCYLIRGLSEYCVSPSVSSFS